MTPTTTSQKCPVCNRPMHREPGSCWWECLRCRTRMWSRRKPPDSAKTPARNREDT